MKKTLIKSLSAFLVLVLILSILPMAAFAAEADSGNAVAPCAATCSHTVAVAYDCEYEYLSNALHNATTIRHVSCPICDYSYTLRGETRQEAHFSNTPANGGYATCSGCGGTYTTVVG